MSAEATVTIIVTTADGDVFNVGQATDTATAFVESRDIDGGNAQIKKILKRLVLRIGGRSVLTDARLIIKGRNDLDMPKVVLATIELAEAEVVTSTSRDAPIPVGTEITRLKPLSPIKLRIAEVKYYSFRIEDDAIKGNWAIFAIEGYGVLGSAGRF